VAQSFADLNRKMEAVERDLSGQLSRQAMARVGEAVQGEIEKAVTADIGDTSMSGFRRGNSIKIVGTSKVISDHEVKVQPDPSTGAKGAMAVLERGRNQGNAGGMAGPGVSADGTTRRTKSGAVRKVRARQSRRWNGTTRGRGTWSDATEIMTREMPKRYVAELDATIGKFITGRG